MFSCENVTKFKDNHDIIYQGRCPKIGCNDHYLGETDGRISERVLERSQLTPFRTFYRKWAFSFRYEQLQSY